MPEKIGVFLCHCGKNIAATVDIPKLKEELEKNTDLTVKDHIFMCSENGQILIKETIENEKLEGVVVASCSPKHHGGIFTDCIKDQLNPYMWEMANIREQCSWVHDDIEVGTKKALALVSGAIERIKKHKPIEQIKVSVNKDVCVIGGGISGIHTAIELADKDFHVIVVEKEPTIGGNMIKLDRTFPTDDCSMCTISPILNEAINHENIDIMVYSEVDEVGGRPGEYKIKINRKAKYVDPTKCTGCGVCSEKCPTKVPNEFEFGMGKRKAIYIPFAQAVPLKYVIDADHCMFLKKGKCGVCAKKCPTKAINYEDKDEEIEVTVGSIVVATGYEQFDLSNTEFNIEHPNVITGLELERMLSPAGPTAGEIIRLSDDKKPDSVTFIQCAGSRDERHNAYCSKICCLYASKNSQLIKNEYPDMEINICYIDFRTGGKNCEEYYRRLRGYGINMIRGRPSEILPEKDDKLVFDVYDTITDKLLQIKTDLVILSCAMVPSKGTRKMAELLHIPYDFTSFLSSLHMKIAPVDTSNRGIYIVGTAEGPKPIQECIVDAGAAASRVATFLKDDELTLDLITANLNSNICMQCGRCAEECPFDAIKKDDELYQVLPISCHSCGKCAAICPTNACDLEYSNDEQILAAVDGILAVDNDSVIAYSCNQCGYNAADLAGTAKMDYPSSVKIVKIPCSARLSFAQMLYPFTKGAKGVMVAACLEDQCHYIDGNLGAKERAIMAKKLLDLIGIGGKKLQFFNISSADSIKFAESARFMEEVCA